MGKKITGFKTKGMNQDLSVSAFNPEFAFENYNLRLSTNEGNTLMSWVNERGTSPLSPQQSTSNPGGNNVSGAALVIQGTTLGTAVINHQLVLFTHSTTNTPDRIYKLWFEDTENDKTLKGELLYEGNLNFQPDHPIETLVSYEAETVQKVYWVDGINQPRVINICKPKSHYNDSNYTSWFDFVPDLQLNETVTVEKLLGANGMFAPGVIQYAFTYYNKYGQESNIFYVTPLNYISFADRGASPEEKVDNAFKITVGGIDTHFEYLRIYSIQRTSLNGIPFCKRVYDAEISSNAPITFTDNGLVGDTIDPTELLYKGGEVISAGTMEQKDGTLFLGDIKVKRENVSVTGIEATINSGRSQVRVITPTAISSSPYKYSNQLNSNCAGFKHGDSYLLGVQFQHKSGRWSDPIKLGEYEVTGIPSENNTTVSIPKFSLNINYNTSTVESKGYIKMRPVVVFPNIQERKTLCQGVVCPTMCTTNNKGDGGLWVQSSWFFRDGKQADELVGITPEGRVDRYLPYQSNTGTSTGTPQNIKTVEIQGCFDQDNQFQITKEFMTFHSPDIIFDEQLQSVNYNGLSYRVAGKAGIDYVLSDISIQTETPTISNSSNGFIHKSYNINSNHGIVSGLFYDDFIVKDFDDNIGAWPEERSSVKWMVYLWNKTGSLNNDINRPADKGVGSAILKKKVISNLRYATSEYSSAGDFIGLGSAGLFNSEEPDIIKVSDRTYMGNIDTVLNPDKADGMYFAFNSNEDAVSDFKTLDKQTDFTSAIRWKTFALNNDGDQYGLYYWDGSKWVWKEDGGTVAIGNTYTGLVRKRDFVRMKYKSSPHVLFYNSSEFNPFDSGKIKIIDIGRGGSNKFNSPVKEYKWLPCGEPVKIATTLDYKYGDTYYQRWDCLKTYPFTTEDENQVVEIGSFMLETRVNIDGRYDRNRGQLNNLNMNPRNFNLLNPVYSQTDNFFTYRIMDDSFYENTEFPNQITYSMTKQSGADVDEWTHVTLASVLELDGDKGRVNSLQRLDDQLIAFQDSGISQILYNESVQVSSSEGVPIEIANSGKVQGKRYFTNSVGCSNKWSIAKTPSGLYFMDSNEKSIYLFNGQLQNISTSMGFNSWAKRNIPSADVRWTPEAFDNFVAYYDKYNQDVLFINKETALAFSEKVGAFTSFYSYGNIPFFCSLDDIGIWVKEDTNVSELWQHRAGDYCRFFGVNKPYSMTLVGNPEAQADKIFTNLEFRACVDGDGELNQNTGKFTFALPFDSLEVWNEYQHGYAELRNRDGHSAMTHHTPDMKSSLKRKFRIWRCDIPRDNYSIPILPDNPTEEQIAAYNEAVAAEESKGIFRTAKHPMDRMRNPWLYLKLEKNAAADETDNEEETIPHSLDRTEVHDMILTYFV